MCPQMAVLNVRNENYQRKSRSNNFLCKTNGREKFEFFQFADIMFYFNTLFSALFTLQIASSTVHIPRILFDPCRSEEAGKFVKDRYDCRKFYYCALNGKAVSVDCPYGMIFNDEKHICDFASNYHCVPEKKEEDQIEVSLTSGVPVSSTATPADPIGQDGHCPMKDDGRLVFLRNNNECHRYYLCYHGYPIPQECIQELHWNQHMGRCDFPENAGCLVATTTLPSTTAAAVIGGAINCPFRGEQVFPHPEHCSYFIYCVNGYASVQQCPFFHHYDVQSRSCKWRTMAKCIANKE